MQNELELLKRDAEITEYLNEVVWGASTLCERTMRRAWDNASERIENFIPRIGEKDIALARDLLTIWKEAREAGDDFRLFSGIISGRLIPQLTDCIRSYYEGLEITEEPWIFSMTPSGCFTVKDTRTGRFLHSTYDPMQEAAALARVLYKTSMDSVHILGSGLGYLAYQLWLQSKKTLKIHIYEEDRAMLSYAFQIGALGRIDEKDIVLVNNEDTEYMLQRFFGTDDRLHDHYISDWKVRAYPDSRYGGMIEMMDMNGRTRRMLGVWNEVNQRRNEKRDWKPVRELKLEKKADEFVLVSAGPSLDDNIAFIKAAKGKKCIIAVNTVLKRLQEEAVVPDLAVMMDPLPELRHHIEGIEWYTKEIPLITVAAGSSDFMGAYEGDIYFLPGDDESEPEGYAWDIGGTVASLGLELACYLGAKVIYLIGNDLAFVQGKNFSHGVAHSEKEGLTEGIEVPGTDGGTVRTTLQYNLYRQILERQIAGHPEVTVYNLSMHGALIHGTKSLPEKERQ